MSEVNRKWRDNAFFHDINKRDRAEAILVIADGEERVTTQQLTVRKFQPDGNLNPDWKELMDSVGEEKIRQNTIKRNDRKSAEAEKRKKEEESKRKVKELEHLFEAKVRTLEIEEIKNSTNSELKARLRRSKNVVEMNTIATLIMMDSLGVKFVIEEKGKDEE